MNKVIISGNLGKDPEVRYSTDNQKAICRFTVAVNEGYGDKQQTMWVNIVSFGKTAENCGKFLKKGRKVLADGRLQIRDYQKQDGTKGTSVEVVANNIEFLNVQSEAKPFGKPTQWAEQKPPQQQAMPGFMQVNEEIPF